MEDRSQAFIVNTGAAPLDTLHSTWGVNIVDSEIHKKNI